MENGLSNQIIEAAVEVHKVLGGPGLLESVYESALCHELSLRGLRCERQLPIPVTYKNVTVRDPLFLDILVEKKLIIEVKASERDFAFYPIQLLTYLRLTGLKNGLLINFGKKQLSEGIAHVDNKS
jgi:GxxExxY protein